MVKPVVVAIDMGYGHLRPAAPLAQAFGVQAQHLDRPPLGREIDASFWRRTRKLYEPLTRASQLPAVGTAAQALLDRITSIPKLVPGRDLSAPSKASRFLAYMGREKGLGLGLSEHLRQTGAPLLTTFYAPALLAEVHGCRDLFCVVTDSDVNRIWAPAEPRKSAITYFVPTEGTQRRLQAYGVAADRVRVTGFPLPHELLGGPELPALRRNLAARLVRLDPRGAFRTAAGTAVESALGPLPRDAQGIAPLLTFAIGGAGAQQGLLGRFLPSLAPLIARGKLRLALVAGVRREVASRMEREVRAAGLEGHPAVRILAAAEVESYLASFNALLAETDLLWTKPSEMTFFAALGLPLVLAPPVGIHELANQRWAVEHGAALLQREPAQAGDWLRAWLDDGVLAAAAWAGYLHLPHRGLYRIVDEVARVGTPAGAAAL